MHKIFNITSIDHIINQFISTPPIEWLAFGFGVGQVALAWQNKILNFYAGIISVGLYVYIFYDAGLFAESLLNIYYFIVSIAGIILWQRTGSRTQLPITRAGAGDWRKVIALVFGLLVLLFLILNNYTSSTVPFADALVTALAWTGTWLMIHRKLENWIVLNISNAMAIPLQWHKGLELTSILTIIYFIIALLGYFKWKKIIREQKFADPDIHH